MPIFVARRAWAAPLDYFLPHIFSGPLYDSISFRNLRDSFGYFHFICRRFFLRAFCGGSRSSLLMRLFRGPLLPPWPPRPTAVGAASLAAQFLLLYPRFVPALLLLDMSHASVPAFARTPRVSPFGLGLLPPPITCYFFHSVFPFM